jgi:hypothetical protein
VLVLVVFPHSFPASSPEYSQWILPVLSLLGGGLGGVLGGFLSKRGEIAAIQGKLDTVVNQNNRLTLEAEEIKRQVSGRQRIWELKRETAYEFASLSGTATELYTRTLFLSHEIRNSELPPEARERKRSELTDIDRRVKQMMESLWGLEGRVYLVFGLKAAGQIQDLINSVMDLISSAQTNTREQIADKQRLYIANRSALITGFKQILDEGN